MWNQDIVESVVRAEGKRVNSSIEMQLDANCIGQWGLLVATMLSIVITWLLAVASSPWSVFGSVALPAIAMSLDSLSDTDLCRYSALFRIKWKGITSGNCDRGREMLVRKMRLYAWLVIFNKESILRHLDLEKKAGCNLTFYVLREEKVYNTSFKVLELLKIELSNYPQQRNFYNQTLCVLQCLIGWSVMAGFQRIIFYGKHPRANLNFISVKYFSFHPPLWNATIEWKLVNAYFQFLGFCCFHQAVCLFCNSSCHVVVQKTLSLYVAGKWQNLLSVRFCDSSS